MIHKSIKINNLELSFGQKICFENFNAQINYGDRIAIIGRNGSGKSSLIKILQTPMLATSGDISIAADTIIGYIPQIIDSHTALSGGQRFNLALSQVLKLNPNILLLDEPTNHLDSHNRKSLMRMLKNYCGTLIIVSHDLDLLRYNVDILWHIDQCKIKIFNGCYDDYMREINLTRSSIERELLQLKRQKKEVHHTLIKEQKRSAQSTLRGKKNQQQQKWPAIVAQSKAGCAQQTSGRRQVAINQTRNDLNQRLNQLYLPDTIIPKFSLMNDTAGYQTIVSIIDGMIAYNTSSFVIDHIHLYLTNSQRIALTGDNGCGKSSLVKAILGDSIINKTGTWHQPHRDHIGYLDQHYHNLHPHQTVVESLKNLVPTWSHADIRNFLNDFLFKTNDEINMPIQLLSGGEKARLCLAHIAAKPPKLLILDEITNNLDLETRNHVINVLKNYPGAMIVISHDNEFLRQTNISDVYKIEHKTLIACKI